MNVNFCKLRSPDFTLGKILVVRKAIADVLKLLINQPNRESFRFAKLMFTVKPRYTMVTNTNLLTLYRLVQRLNSLDVSGDIVECGVWNGGSAAILGLANLATDESRRNRKIWLFDSFQGVPPATERDGSVERRSYFEGWNKGDVDKVKQVFTKLGVPLDQVKIVSGWFNETLKTADVEQIAMLHIDADWYDSVKLVLDTFYDKVLPGGFIVLNDYNTWEGCNKALNDFLTERHVKDIVITEVEPTTGAYFQKPRN
jgi:O-methyltransferase